MELTGYMDFAENDYRFFMKAYEDGYLFNSMAAMAQSACERFLKHVIDGHFAPRTPEQEMEKSAILRTHSLRKLLHFLDRRMDIVPTDEVKNEILRADGFYFTTKYPGDESITIGRGELEDCKTALCACRTMVLEIMEELSRE